MSKRQYSDREKAAALAFLDFNGGNVERSAKALGIPRVTLLDWSKGRKQHPEVSDLRHEKKEQISELIERAVREMIQGSAGKVADANLSQVWTSIGIAVDKMQLLKGEATAITKDATQRTNEERAARIMALVKPGATEEAA